MLINSFISTELKYSYPIVETFHSIQGEGFYSGVNAYFIRLAGCDVYCPWCDQKESWNDKKFPKYSVEKLLNNVQVINPNIVIITGGEPLLHDLYPLTNQLQKNQFKVHLETSGAHPFSGNFDWVTFSPKIYKKPHDSIYQKVNELKVVINDKKDLEWAQLEAKKIPNSALKYLQPEWNNFDSKDLILDFIKSNSQWRLSLQIHKFLNVQ